MHSALATLLLSALAAAQGPPPPQGPAAPAPPQGPGQGPAAPATPPGPDQGAPASQTTTPLGNPAPLPTGDIDGIDANDIPQQCWQTCQPLIDLTRRCHDTHDTNAGPDGVDDEAAERNCVCTAQDAANQVSQCQSCLVSAGPVTTGGDRDGRGGKGPDRVMDLARACNFAVAGGVSGTGTGAMPPNTTPAPGQAPQGVWTYVCQVDDDNDGRGRHVDDCRAFPGSAAPTGYACTGPLGCTTTYVPAGGALPGGVAGSGAGTGMTPMGSPAPTGNQPFVQNPPGASGSGGVGGQPGLNAAGRLPVTGAAAVALVGLAFLL